jgi:phytoene dehydrogenase-like protein
MTPLRELAGKLLSPEYFFGGGDGLLAPDDLETLEERLRRCGCSVRLRRVLAVPCFWMGIPEDECPVIYHHVALLSYLLSAWRLRGTGADFADHLVVKLRERGGDLILGDPAAAVLLNGNGVAQVLLASGRPLKADAAVAAIHPKLLLDLLPAGALSIAQSRRIRHLQDTFGMFAAHFVVDGRSHPPLPHNTFHMETDREGRLTDVLFCQLLGTPVGTETLLSLLTASPDEDWRAWDRTRTGRRGAEYDQIKRARADALLQKAKKVFGSFKNVRFLDSFTTLTLRDWVGSPGGSAYGICRSRRQLFTAALLHRLPVRGLFLAGQNALAPGIFGTLAGSFQAVRQMIGPERFNREVAFRPGT